MTQSMHAHARGIDAADAPISHASTVTKRLECGCGGHYPPSLMLRTCPACGSANLRYTVSGRWTPPQDGAALARHMWRYFDLLPLDRQEDVVTLNEGGSAIIELPDTSTALGGARLFLLLDGVQNPTGTFKDREASLIISRCRALGMDNLVFYSTANTGRAYMHYAASLGLTTYLFVPAECRHKLTATIDKGPNQHVIAVDGEYPRIAPYAKAFAAANGLTLIAPLHDRTEAYTTLAFEQVERMPECDFFAQTIASGMGPIGFLRGHEHLARLGARPDGKVPRVICVQSSETNAMSRAYQAGKSELTEADLPAEWPTGLFEPTLNSTNPINNYPDLVECLRNSNGLITDVPPAFVMAEAPVLVRALERAGVALAFDLEKSLLIGYSGLVRLANEGTFQPGDRILLLATGRGARASRDLIPPDLVIRPSVDDPKDVYARLTSAAV
jgi:threonine synthase